MRLFAAIYPPEDVLDHLESALEMLGPPPAPVPRTDRRQGGRARRAALRPAWPPRSAWHLTIAFFGQVPAGALPDLEVALEDVAAGLEPLALHLAGAGSFRGTVSWVGVGGDTDGLSRTMRRVAEVRTEVLPASSSDERVRNRAHLTISRGGVDPARVAHALAVYRGPAWTADAIDLVESELGQGESGRPRHTVLRRLPLGGPGGAAPSHGRQ